jgi:hypothetical protein
LADDKSYQEIKKLIESGEEAYNKAKNIKASQNRVKMTQAVFTATDSKGEAIGDMSNITSFD